MLIIIIGIIIIIICLLLVHRGKKKYKDDNKVLTKISIIVGEASIIITIISISLTIIDLVQNNQNNNITHKTRNNVEIDTTRIVDTPNDTTPPNTSTSDSIKYSSVKTIESSEETTSQVKYHKDRINIERIYKAGDVIIVNLRFDQSFYGEVSVSVPQKDICSLDNKGDFPQRLWSSRPTFCVKLKQKTKRVENQDSSEFIIDAKSDYNDGSYSVVKKVDIQRCIEIH